MKIVIQDTMHGSFLYPDGSWGRRIEEARDFASTTDAEKFCREKGLRHVEIVVTFGGDRAVRLKP